MGGYFKGRAKTAPESTTIGMSDKFGCIGTSRRFTIACGLRGCFFAAQVLLVSAVAAQAQTTESEDGGLVSMLIDIDGTNSSGRAYGPLDSLIVRIKINNEAERPLIGDQRLLRSAITVGAESSGPVSVAWNEEALRLYRWPKLSPVSEHANTATALLRQAEDPSQEQPNR